MPLDVLLVNAPNEIANRNASNYACHPHIGIVQLATAVRDRLSPPSIDSSWPCRSRTASLRVLMP
jgi:hypothetical protein